MEKILIRPSYASHLLSSRFDLPAVAPCIDCMEATGIMIIIQEGDNPK